MTIQNDDNKSEETYLSEIFGITPKSPDIVKNNNANYSKSGVTTTSEKVSNVDQTPTDPPDVYHPESYPGRRGPTHLEDFKAFVVNRGQAMSRDLCERNAYSAMTDNHAIKMLMSGLKTFGCPFDIRRHISCEECTEGISAGYDPEHHQIILCKNNLSSWSSQATATALAHEMVHMFDHCRAKMDFNNMEHVACTEIRAASFMHCYGTFNAWINGDGDLTGADEGHKKCVMKRAANSLSMLHHIPLRESLVHVDKVFDRCYNDLEPFGRRFQLWSDDETKLIYEQRRKYGYY